MERKFVRPGVGADGKPLASRHPTTRKPLSPDGEWVDYDSVARRRLKDGDWVEAEPPQPAEQPPAPPDAPPADEEVAP